MNGPGLIVLGLFVTPVGLAWILFRQPPEEA